MNIFEAIGRSLPDNWDFTIASFCLYDAIRLPSIKLISALTPLRQTDERLPSQSRQLADDGTFEISLLTQKGATYAPLKTADFQQG